MSQTIKNGQSLRLSIPSGQSIAISSVTGTYSATIVGGASYGTVLATDSTGGGTFGPYATGAIVQLSAGADSVIDFDIGTSLTNAYDQNAKLSFDLSGNVAGIASPTGGLSPISFILKQSAIPVILAPNGTVAANGVVTLGTALPTTYASAWVYLPAGAISGGAAGLYYAVFSSTTVGQIYTTFVSGASAFTPYIPASLTAAVGSGSAYTQTTATVSLLNITLSGGLMGANGSVRVRRLMQRNATGISNANHGVFLGGVDMYSNLSLTTANRMAGVVSTFANRGVQNSQIAPYYAPDTGFNTAVATGLSVNTAIDQPLSIQCSLITATDYIVLEGFTVEVLPAA
jgi:hypothetical protein